MARVGRFGNLPSKAQDLSATVISLYEQYEAQRDRNIITAWQNGGNFEGKPVTDAVITAWFKMRVGQTSPGDPMRNYWQEQLHQTQFTIAEQKAKLHYTREPNAVVGDRYMVDFYKHWSSTLPRASSAWRTMMTSAAQFAKAARAAASSGAASARAKAFADAVNNVEKNRIAPGYATLQAVYDFAVGRGLMSPSTSGSILSAFDFTSTQLGGQAPQSGVGGAPPFAVILDNVMSSSDWPTIRAEIRKQAGAGWDGKLTDQHVLSMLDQTRRGYLREAQIRAHYGDASGARTARQSARDVAASTAHFRSIFSGDYAHYTTLHDTFHASISGSTSPLETVDLASKYATDLLALADKAGARGDLVLEGQLRTEAASAQGQTPGNQLAITENTQGGKGTNAATDVNQVLPDTTGKATGGVSGALSGTGQAQTSDQALAFAMQTAQYEAKGLSDGSLVMTVDSNNQMQIVPRATMQSVGKGNPVITVGVPTAGATYTDASGKVVQLPSAILPQAVTLMPVYVTVPKDVTNPDAQLAPGVAGTNLPTSLSADGSQLQSKFAGYRFDNGNGVIGYAHPTGQLNANGQPELVFSAVPPYVNSPGAIHSEGIQSDGTYRVEYSVAWIDGQAKDGPLGSILAPVYKTDAKGNYVLDLNNTKITTGYTFNPSQVVQGGISTNGQYLFGAQGPQLGAPPPGSPQPPPGTGTTLGPPLPQGYTPPAATPTTPGAFAPGQAGALLDQPSLLQQAQTALGGLFAPQAPETLPPGVHSHEEYQRLIDTGQITPQGQAILGPPLPSAVPTKQFGTVDVAAQAQAQTDAFNNLYYATLTTHPNFLGWGNATLFAAGWSAETRKAFSQLPPDQIIASLQRDDPLFADPTHQAAILGQVDVLRGSGISGQTEGQFLMHRAFTGGSLLDLGQGAFDVGRSFTTPSILSALGNTPVSAITPPAGKSDPFGIHPGTVNAPQPYTKLPGLTVPQITPAGLPAQFRTGASQAAHQLGASDIYTPTLGRTGVPIIPKVQPTGVASLPSVTPTTVPTPPQIKAPNVPPPPPIVPPPPLHTPPPPDAGGGKLPGGRYQL